MAFQFRKLITVSVLFSSTYLFACCCNSQINSTTNAIKNYIRGQNLDITTKYLSDYDTNMSAIVGNELAVSEAVRKIKNVEYNTSAKNGILLKLKKQNSLLQKQNSLLTY